MITNNHLPQTTIRFFVIAILMFGMTLLFPAANSASSEPGKQASSKLKENYNRLINESSPYLLQHATNPVDWFPWGTEAFDKAKREDKPVFLSIGYSTCHWCHVMEHESFSDKEVADLLNKDFISIKVDREERPDIDHVYMTVTQALTGSGGWPMTIIMTADKKPFYAGTYFPKNRRWGRPGMMELLPKIAELWRNDRNKILDSADRITRHVAGLGTGRPGTNLDRQILDQTQAFFVRVYDSENGGLYMTADDSEKLLVRSKVIYDGAIPSGNSVAVLNLLRLGHMTGNTEYLTKAEQIIKSFSAEIAVHPAGHSQLMVAMEFALNTNYEVVIVGNPQKNDTVRMLAALRKPFLPEKVVLFRPMDKQAAKDITAIAPFTLSMVAKNGQATAYVCQEFACKLPTTSIDQMLENIRQN